MKKQATSRKAQKLRAVQTSRHLHVAKHRHTGHVLPRRSTSYPVLAMIVLCVGVLLFSWTRIVTADTATYTVHASVPGPPPSQAATIDSPTDGNRFSATPITVRGSCPKNTYVNLLRNGFSSGVALCDASGAYTLITDLFRGTDQLVARVYSFTDQAGPDSAMVTVHYLPAGTTLSNFSGTPYNPKAAASAGLPEPLLLNPNFTLLGYYVGQTASWQVKLEGGIAPYAVSVDWGDGQHTLYSRSQAGELSLSHVYAQPGGHKGGYTVRITASDADGTQTVVQLVAIVSGRAKTVFGAGNGVASTGSSSGLFGGGSLGRIITYSWTGYGVVLLMLVSFWLGERRELGYLRVHRKRPRHA